MKCNLIVLINEITIRDYTLVEDEGLVALVGSRPELSFTYEDDEEKPGKYVSVIGGTNIADLFKFLDFTGIPICVIL